MAFFYRQLATLLNAGVSVAEALATLAATSPNRRLRACLGKAATVTGRGGRLSTALAEAPRMFSPFERAVIAAGEQTGNLTFVFRMLADRREAEMAVRAEIRRTMFTPKITLAVTLLFWPFVFMQLQQQPLLLIVFGILPLAAFGVLLLLGGLLPRLNGPSSAGRDRLIAAMPVLGKTARHLAQAQAVRTLAHLAAAGLPLPQAVELTANACGNTLLARRLRPVVARLRSGEGIAQAMMGVGLLDRTMLPLLTAGETTGDPAPLLNKAAEFLDLSTGLALHQLKVALVVAATLNVGVCVGIVAYMSYVPK